MKKYHYTCQKCGYQRSGLLDHGDFDWICPKCKVFGTASVKFVLVKDEENEDHLILNIRQAEANHILNLLRQNQNEGSYTGNKKYYWKRHKELLKKIEKLLK